MDFYAGKMSLLNDIAQIETTLGDPGARPRRPLPDPKDTHRSTHTQMALFGPTIAWYEAYNLCDQPAPDGEPGGAGGRDKRGTENVGVLEAAGVPCGPVYGYGQMFADPQVRHRGLVQYASDAELGEVPHLRTPIKIGDSVRVRNVAPSSASTSRDSRPARGERSGGGEIASERRL